LTVISGLSKLTSPNIEAINNMTAISVVSLLTAVGLKISGSTKWGQRGINNKPGIYIVSVSEDPSDAECNQKISISDSAILNWLTRVPSMRLHGQHPSREELISELSRFWLPEQNIIYIGKAGTSLRNRINQFYTTNLGDRKPHGGGSWIKTLSNLDHATIYWVTTDQPESNERLILHHFNLLVSANQSDIVMPFGNLETYLLQNNNEYRCIRKAHNLKDWKLS